MNIFKRRHQREHVSEVTNLDPDQADVPISDGDHIAGAPTTESGEIQEGNEIGPEARMRNEHHERGQ
ncbi:MAG: hypothetical protein ACTHJM_07030 [Marmoricola sp.]